MMFYSLDGFTQCLPSFFHLGVGSNPTSCIAFNILRRFNQMVRWANRSVRHGQQADVSCLARATVWPSICGGVVWDMEIGCTERAVMQQVNLK